METITLRRALPGDADRIMILLDQVLNVHHQGRPDLFKAHGSKYRREELLALMQEELRPIYVAVDETGTVLGYAFCILQEIRGDSARQDGRTLYVDDLCVDRALRGKGVGGILLDHVRAEARRLRCQSVTLNVWAENKSARRFYEKQGFQVQKIGMEELLH